MHVYTLVISDLHILQWRVLVERITIERLVERNVTFLEVAVAEAAAQQASYSRTIEENKLASLKDHVEELRAMAVGVTAPTGCFSDKKRQKMENDEQ